jgi:hypothetical protein
VVPRRRIGCELVVALEPALHDANLWDLRLIDLVREFQHLRIRAVGLGHAGHDDRLCVVRDHSLHELDVGLGVQGAFRDHDLMTHVHAFHSRHAASLGDRD